MKITITSPQNELVKKIAKLHNARTRRELRRFLVEGRRACEPFFGSRYPLAYLLITEEHVEWTDTLAIDPEKIYLTTTRVIEKLSSATSPSGVIAVFDIPTEQPIEKVFGPGIVLANIQDPGNTGTLIRTAGALNATIIIVDGADPYNQKVIQASAGALAYAKLVELSWEELVTQAQTANITLTALVVEHGTDIRTLDRQTPRLLVIGNEANGIPAEWLKNCTEQATLPMPGRTESLNAAVAGSIALYNLSLWGNK